MGLDLDGVTVHRGGVAVVERVSAVLPAGGIAALCGPNGAGKSSLLAAVAGVLPYTGEIAWDRARIDPAALGFLPQAVGIRAHLSVLEVVLLGRMERLGWRLTDADLEAAGAALETVGMAHLAARRVDMLSGGQQQLVLLAQRIVRRPRLLLLDEPTSALDLRRQLLMLDLLEAYARSTGALVVVVLHDLSLAARYATTLLLLRDGRLAGAGAPRHVLTADTVRDVYGVETEVLSTSAGHPVLAPLAASPLQTTGSR